MGRGPSDRGPRDRPEASRVRRAVGVVALLFAMTCAGLWPLSHVIRERVLIPLVDRGRGVVVSENGAAHAVLIWRSGGLGGGFEATWEREQAGMRKDRPGLFGFNVHWRAWEMSGNRARSLKDRTLGLRMPYWALTVAGSVAAAWGLGNPRARKGMCIRCGYDLRATPGPCPECGADAPTC